MDGFETRLGKLLGTKLQALDSNKWHQLFPTADVNKEYNISFHDDIKKASSKPW